MSADQREFEATKNEYENAAPKDESARLRYVTKLAKMHAQILDNYWNTHDKTVFASDLANAVDEELYKHPAPSSLDSRKLSQLLVGKWQGSRHIYVFTADHRPGMEDSPMDETWRINGNEYSDDFSRGPIILLDRDYFIYRCGQGVFFYMRVKDSGAERNQSSADNTTETESAALPIELTV